MLEGHEDMKRERIIHAKEIKCRKLRDFDARFGVDFSKTLTRTELGYEDGHCFGYQPSFVMPNILSHLNISSQDSILDVGCGKGFAMHLFSSLPFSKIDGIELNNELVQIAKENLQILHPDDNRFHVFKEDAFNFTHYNDYDMLYLFNPFDEHIINAICLKFGIIRPSKVIYQIPHYINTFTKYGFAIEYEADATVVLRR